MERTKRFLHKQGWLAAVLAIVVLLRIPSLFEPYWYGDEGVYLTIGQALNRGAELYKGIHDNKPPFLYFMAMIAGGNQFWFRFLAMAWNAVTIVVFAGLAQKIMGEKGRAVKMATAAFAGLTVLPLFEGNIANAELWFLLPTVLAVAVLWDSRDSWKRALLGGVLLGLGGLFKIPAVVEAGIWPLVWWRWREKGWVKKMVMLGVGVALPLLISGVYYWSRGVGGEFLMAAGLQNLPYLSSWVVGSGKGIFTLTGRAGVLVILAGMLLWTGERWGRRGTVVGLWGLFALFGALLSGRPYPHYLMQVAGPLAMAGGLIVSGSKAERRLAGGVGGVVVAVWWLFKFYAYPIAGYYANFLKWVGGGQTKQAYYTWFNGNVMTNYEIAKIVMGESKTEDRLFIWGDEPMIYALAKRLPATKYTVRYHIKDFRAEAETIHKLAADRPKYIVSFGREEELPGLTSLLEGKYILEKTVGTGKIYRLSGVEWWKY